MAWRRSVLILHIAVILGLTYIAAKLAWQGQLEFAITVFCKAGFLLVLLYAEQKYELRLSSFIKAGFLIAVASDSILGFYVGLYVTSTIFDKVQHVYGSYTFALMAYNLSAPLNGYALTKVFRFVLVLSFGLAIGALYEIGEFIGDVTTKPAIPAQTGLLDTNLDLISDLAGSLLAACHAAFKDPLQRKDLS